MRLENLLYSVLNRNVCVFCGRGYLKRSYLGNNKNYLHKLGLNNYRSVLLLSE